MTSGQVIEAIDSTVPSAELVQALVDLDPAGFDVGERLVVIAAWERVLSWATAMQQDLLVDADRVCRPELHDLHAAPKARWYAERVGVALGISGASAQRRMSQAVTLAEKLPLVTAALRGGVVTVHHARVAAARVTVLDVEVARAVDAAVMADPDWRTPSQLERRLARTILQLDPEGARRRHGRARTERRVSVRDEPDGMCSLWARLPAEQGHALHKTLDAHARSSAATSGPGDRRTLDHRRADALVELVVRGSGDTDGSCGQGEPTLHGRSPQIHVTVAWSTLLGADDAPADLTGYGPIDADTARRIAADPNSVWRRLLTDPASGQLLDHGRSTYRPPRDLQDFVIARDRHCRFPTCDRSAVLCDLDHRTSWDDHGITAPDNLDALCRTHHRLKHEGGWTHHRDPGTGESVWTDPAGRTHQTPPPTLPTPPPVEPPAARPPELDDDPPF